MTEFAGTLRERVIIERPVSVRNTMGLQEPGWEQVCQCLAAVMIESVGPESEAQALSSMARFRVTIRQRDGIRVGHRVRWNGRSLLVRQLLDDPRTKDRIVMRCEEVRG
jgi:SPP1 family predicted phage head-tail adaptor